MDGNIATLAQGQFAAPGLQYSTNPYQVPDGHGLAALYAASQPWTTQGWYGNVVGQGAQPVGGLGGIFGYPQLGGIWGGWGGQLPNLNAISASAQGCNAASQQLASQGWLGNLIGQPGQFIGSGFGGAIGHPQFGGYLGSQLIGSPQAQTIQYATQQAAQVAQQVALQAAQQAAQQVGQQAAQAAQQVAQLVANQTAQQVAQQAAITAQQVAQQVAQQAAQQVAQQAAQQAAYQAAQVAQQAAQQAVAHIGQQTYSPWNALGVQYTTPQPWLAQGGFGNFLGQQQPFGINLGGAFGYPQIGPGVGGFGGQIPWNSFQYSTVPQSAFQGGIQMSPFGLRALNPFAGVPLGTQTQMAGAPRFSFA